MVGIFGVAWFCDPHTVPYPPHQGFKVVVPVPGILGSALNVASGLPQHLCCTTMLRLPIRLAAMSSQPSVMGLWILEGGVSGLDVQRSMTMYLPHHPTCPKPCTVISSAVYMHASRPKPASSSSEAASPCESALPSKLNSSVELYSLSTVKGAAY